MRSWRRNPRAPMSLTETARSSGPHRRRMAARAGARSSGIAAARRRAIRDGALRRGSRPRGPAPRRARLHDQQVRRGLGRDAVRAAFGRRIREALRARLRLPCELRSRPRPPSPAPGRREAAATVSERADGRPQAAGRQPVGAGARDQQACGSADQLRRAETMSAKNRSRTRALRCGSAGTKAASSKFRHADRRAHRP